MSVWNVDSVELQPCIRLERWRAVRVGESRFLIGYNLDDREGRVSTAIAEVDPDSLSILTVSGRIYRIVSMPSYCGDAECVLAGWRRINRVAKKATTSATDEVLRDLGLSLEDGPATIAQRIQRPRDR